MKRGRRVIGAAVVALGTLSIAADWARAQEETAPAPIRFRPVWERGDVVVREQVLVVDVELTGSAPGQPEQNFTFNYSMEDTAREEVVAATNRLPTALKRTWSLFRMSASGPGVSIDQTLPLQGKSAMLRRTGNKIQVTSAVKLTPEQTNALKATYILPHVEMLPNRPARPGYAWRLDPKGLFMQGKTGSVRCRFAEVVEFEGHPCARIEVSGQVTQRLPTLPGPMRSGMTGDVHYALDLQRLMQVSLGGPVSMTGKTKVNGVTHTVRGEGTADATLTNRYLKIAGKPVPEE